MDIWPHSPDKIILTYISIEPPYGTGHQNLRQHFHICDNYWIRTPISGGRHDLICKSTLYSLDLIFTDKLNMSVNVLHIKLLLFWPKKSNSNYFYRHTRLHLFINLPVLFVVWWQTITVGVIQVRKYKQKTIFVDKSLRKPSSAELVQEQLHAFFLNLHTLPLWILEAVLAMHQVFQQFASCESELVRD